MPSSMGRCLVLVLLSALLVSGAVVATDARDASARKLHENAASFREGPMQALRVLKAVGEIPSNFLSMGSIGQANYETHGAHFALEDMMRELHSHDLYNASNPDPNAQSLTSGGIGGNSGAAAAQAQEQAKLFPRLNPLNNFEPYDMDKYGVILVEVCGTKVGDKNTDASTGLATSDCVANVNTQMAYLASLAFTGVPGFVIGIICLVFAILFCLCRCICCICCGTNFCPTGTDEEGYSTMTLLIPKVCILGFSFIAVVGCGLGYFGLFALQDALNALVQTLIDAVDKMVGVVEAISSALEVAGEALGESISVGDLTDAAKEIQATVGDSTSSLSGTFELVTNIGLGIGFFYFAMIAFGAIGSFLNINCILYIVLLLGVLVMFTSWIMFGIFFFIANFTSDICTVIGEYLVDPAGSTLGAFFPCLPVSATTVTMTTIRSTLSLLIFGINTPMFLTNQAVDLYNLQPGVTQVPELPYVCDLYEKITLGAACSAELIAETIDSFDGPKIVEAAKWNESDIAAGRDLRCNEPEYLDAPTNTKKNPAYTRCFAGNLGNECGYDCGFYYLGMCSLLGLSDASAGDDMYRARPSAWHDNTYNNDAPACPYTGPFETPDRNTVTLPFTVKHNNFNAAYEPLKCATDDQTACISAETPLTTSSFEVTSAFIPAVGAVNGVTDELDYLMSCRFVYNAFLALNGALCESLLSAASLLWTGFLFVGVCFMPLSILWLFAIATFDKPLGYNDGEKAVGEEDPYTEVETNAEGDPEGKVVEETNVEEYP